MRPSPSAFAMAVTYPAAGNIGGGGFMVVYPADGGDPVVIDTARRPRPPRQGPCSPRTKSLVTHRPPACPAPSAAWPWPTSASASCRGRTSSPRPSSSPTRASPSTRIARRSLNGIVDSRAGVPRAAPRLRQGRRQGRLERRRPLDADRPRQDAAPHRRRRRRTPSTTGQLADLIAAEMKAGGGLITQRRPGGVQGQRAQADPRHLPRLRRVRPAAAVLRRHLPRRDAQHPGELRPEKAGPRFAGDAAPDDRGDAPGLLRPRPLPRRPGLRQDSRRT